jgi:hypothetical protein
MNTCSHFHKLGSKKCYFVVRLTMLCNLNDVTNMIIRREFGGSGVKL